MSSIIEVGLLSEFPFGTMCDESWSSINNNMSDYIRIISITMPESHVDYWQHWN
ncbi:27011_t:CDS:2 [Gigaspora margarita]|uniref:27011_t:CDS:1 n=1 Tax=Gigaspora margarita TaxID=4874 RepID=A0ABM8W366_GIGMA|nr:27011_t:CDS:2 [Gigaspora margarita]